VHRRRWKRIWPTLLSAAAQAAVRARDKANNRNADAYASVILARTSLDAYIHELIFLRQLPSYVQFRTGPGSRKRLSKSEWRLIADARQTLSGLSKNKKKHFEFLPDLQFHPKLQTLLLLLGPEAQHLIAGFEIQFSSVNTLNVLRNAIVHHDFQAPSRVVASTCASLSASLKLPTPDPESPWENLFGHSIVANWACQTISNAILTLESVKYNRRIHLGATRDAIAAALSPLPL
jgi:hypothetical protein